MKARNQTKTPKRVNAPPSTFGFSTQPGHAAPSVGYMNGGFDAFADYLRGQARVVSLTREEFEALPEKAQKQAKNSPCVVLAKFDPPRRDGKCIESVTGLGLDVDKAHVELAQLKAPLKGTSAVIHESLRSKDGARRWRVFIEFARPATVEEHAAAFAYWSKRIPGVALDVKDAPRLWYVPSRFEGEPERIIERVEGLPYQPGASASPAGSPGLAERSRRALLDNIAPPVEVEAGEGNRELSLTRFLMSRVGRVGSEAELLALALEHNQTAYTPPLDESEVRAKVARDWRKHGTRATESPQETTSGEGAVEGDLFLEGVYLPFTEAAPEIPTPIVLHWLPRKSVTLFGSHGGTGKSYVGLEVAVRVALGLDVFGCEAEQANVIFYSCEDEMAVLRDRADRIAVELGHEPDDLDGRLFLLDMTCHEQPELYRETREGGELTPTFTRLFNTVERVEAGLVVIDNASDVFAANENDRARVRQFMRTLKAPAQEMNCAVLLLAHTNKVTAQAKAGEDVQGYSGSTAWHNSSRSRWFMAFDKDDPELRVLSLDKSNYGRSGLSVEVRWHEGKKMLLSGAAVARRPMNELAGIVLAKIAHYEKVGVEMLVKPTSPRGALQKALRRDVPELRLRKATEVQDFLDMLTREGFLAVVERPRGGRNKAAVEVFVLTEKGRA